METRTILQVVLGIIVVTTLGLSGFLVYELTKEAETTVVREIVQADEPVEERINPWSVQGDAAASLVGRVEMTLPMFPLTEEQKKAEEAKNKRKRPKDEVETPEKILVKDALENDEFVAKVLKLKGERLKWETQWWGETKYGPSFFLVRYAFKDANIVTGPTWLVDLKTRKVVAKNLPAQLVENPTAASASEYYDKDKQIVSAIARHRFEQGMSLAGALLVYFEQRTEVDAKDTIDGWTIDHEKGNLFTAYFQWVEKGEPTYAQFEFDYDRKALKPINLQAANIMRIGEEFKKERVSIMPSSYDPTAKPGNRWKGPAKKQCKVSKNRERCTALSTVLDETDVVESLEWLLTERVASAEAFEECKAARGCSWRPISGETGYTIKYVYKLGDAEDRSVSWDIDMKTKEITPKDRVATLAFRAIRPR